MAGPVSRILLITQHPDLIRDLASPPASLRWRVHVAPDVVAAARVLNGKRPRALVLDIQQVVSRPGRRISSLKRAFPGVPILLLTIADPANGEPFGVSFGAEKCVVLPAARAQLFREIRSLLSSSRRTAPRPSRERSAPALTDHEIELLRMFVRTMLAGQAPGRTDPTELSFGNLHADFIRQELSVNGMPVPTSALELRLLRYLAAHAGEAVSREQLLNDVWGYESAPQTRSVDNYVLQLRKKIEEDPAAPVHLLTLRGAGYRFEL